MQKQIQRVGLVFGDRFHMHKAALGDNGAILYVEIYGEDDEGGEISEKQPQDIFPPEIPVMFSIQCKWFCDRSFFIF